jgi:deglycase
MKDALSGLRVAILVADKFEQVEMTEPKAALERAGARTILISNAPGQVHGVHHDDQKGDAFRVDASFGQADARDFDAVLLPGGVINADRIRMIPEAQTFVKSCDADGKPIAVICHGPWLLVSAKLVEGRILTSWPSLRDDIQNAGGKWVDGEVVRDRNWVSSRKPDDIPAFNREIIAVFAERVSAAARGSA